MPETRPSPPPFAVNDELPDDVVALLSKAYDVGEWTAWSRTPKGTSNVTFFVTASTGRYALRRSNARKTLASLDFEVRLVEHLRAADYPAPRVVRTVDGAPHVEHETTYYLLTAFVPGDHFDPDNAEHLTASARALARFHRLAAEVPDPYRAPSAALAGLGAHERVLDETARLGGVLLGAEGHRRLAGALGAFAAAAARLVRSGFAGSSLDEVVTQGSFGRSAALFIGDVLTGVVDYDRAALDLRCLDLAYTVKAFCRASDAAGWVGLDEDRLVAFLRAYQEVEPLDAAELEALPVALQAQRVVKVLKKCENVLAKHAIVPQEPKDVEKVAAIAEREVGRLSWLEDNRTRLVAAMAR